MTYNVFGGTLNLAQSNPIYRNVNYCWWLGGTFLGHSVYAAIGADGCAQMIACLCL